MQSLCISLGFQETAFICVCVVTWTPPTPEEHTPSSTLLQSMLHSVETPGSTRKPDANPQDVYCLLERSVLMQLMSSPAIRELPFIESLNLCLKGQRLKKDDFITQRVSPRMCTSLSSFIIPITSGGICSTWFLNQKGGALLVSSSSVFFPFLSFSFHLFSFHFLFKFIFLFFSWNTCTKS